MVAAMHPSVSDPAPAGMRWTLVVAGSPDVLSAIVTVIAILPHISLARRRTAPLVNRRRGPDADNNLRQRSDRT
jgi:hypothetical protein